MAALRALVAEKFPQPAGSPGGRLLTGWMALDRHGGLRKGSVTEICGSTAGGQLFLAALLDAAVRDGFFIGLVDASHCFEPDDWADEHLSRLLWVMGTGEADISLKAADLLVRDGNLPVLLLDLQMIPARQLRRIPAGAWHRFQRLVEPMGGVFAVLTRQPAVESAATRITIRLNQTPEALHLPRATLLEQLDVQVFERRIIAAPEPLLKTA